MDKSLKSELKRLLFKEEERILNVLGVGEFSSGEELLITDEVLNGGSYDISIRPHTGSVAFPLHRHNFLEIMLVLSGRITHCIDGKTVTLSGGDILFLNKHRSHSVALADKGDVAINVIVSDRFAESLKGELGGTVFAELLKENSSPVGGGVFLHFRAHDRQIENLTENMLRELCEPSPRINVLSRTVELLMVYLSEGSEEYLLDGSLPTDSASKRKRAIASYLKESYKSASLNELAGKLYVTVPYLSRLVKEYFGKTFKELLIEERMRRARRLLTETDIPIGDVIQGVGYENDSYFHREFKKRYGTTPLALRRSCPKR